MPSVLIVPLRYTTIRNRTPSETRLRWVFFSQTTCASRFLWNSACPLSSFLSTHQILKPFETLNLTKNPPCQILLKKIFFLSQCRCKRCHTFRWKFYILTCLSARFMINIVNWQSNKKDLIKSDRGTRPYDVRQPSLIREKVLRPAEWFSFWKIRFS